MEQYILRLCPSFGIEEGYAMFCCKQISSHPLKTDSANSCPTNFFLRRYTNSMAFSGLDDTKMFDTTS